MTAPRPTTTCTHCSGEIPAEAKRCVHCGGAVPYTPIARRVARAVRDSVRPAPPSHAPAPVRPAPARDPATTCSQCLGAVVAGADRCPHCGARLGLRRRARPWIIAGAVVAVLALAGIAVVRTITRSQWSDYCAAHVDDTTSVLEIATTANLRTGGMTPQERASFDEISARILDGAPSEIHDDWTRVIAALGSGDLADPADLAAIDAGVDDNC